MEYVGRKGRCGYNCDASLLFFSNNTSGALYCLSPVFFKIPPTHVIKISKRLRRINSIPLWTCCQVTGIFIWIYKFYRCKKVYKSIIFWAIHYRSNNWYLRKWYEPLMLSWYISTQQVYFQYLLFINNHIYKYLFSVVQIVIQKLFTFFMRRNW